jgi:hypothetical protein
MENRNGPRYRMGVLAALFTSEKQFICFGSLANVLVSGAKLRLSNTIELPKSFELILSSKSGPRRYCSVVWQTDDEVGVRFVSTKNQL